MEIAVITILILLVVVLFVKLINRKPKIKVEEKKTIPIDSLNNYEGIISGINDRKKEDLKKITASQEYLSKTDSKKEEHHEHHHEQQANKKKEDKSTPPKKKKEIFNTEEAIIHNAILKRKDRH